MVRSGCQNKTKVGLKERFDYLCLTVRQGQNKTKVGLKEVYSPGCALVLMLSE